MSCTEGLVTRRTELDGWIPSLPLRVLTHDSMNQSINSLDEQFALFHRRSCELISQLSPALLYQKAGDAASSDSCAEQILRGAGIVEQAFGGLTANLWDDPFEWTLPETLSTKSSVLEYLDEVEGTRQRGFELFKTDHDLSKEIVTPTGPTQLLPFLLDTLERARHHQQRAVATFDRMQQQPALTATLDH